jgi:hypothetical protein
MIVRIHGVMRSTSSMPNPIPQQGQIPSSHTNPPTNYLTPIMSQSHLHPQEQGRKECD